MSRATSDLKQLHDHYIGSLKQISNSIHYPQVMRILAEELVEELSGRFSYLGIPFGDFKQDETPLYWNNYLTAVKSGVILGNEYARFLKADKLATPFLNDSYIDEVEYIDGGYKAMRKLSRITLNTKNNFYKHSRIFIKFLKQMSVLVRL